MIKIESYKGKKLALFGLGKSGIVTALALMAGGAEIICWDDNENARLNAAKYNIALCNLKEINWQDISALILAPGVNLHYPQPHWSAELARKYNIEILGDIELFVRERRHYLARNKLVPNSCPFIAITGTNGKSTTTNLIAHLLKLLGKNVQMGGNIGRPILELEPFAVDNYYVIECSSFQIDLAPTIDPTIAILLNITLDHIERHGNFANYAKSKKALLKSAYSSIVNSEILAQDPLLQQSANLICVGKNIEWPDHEIYYNKQRKLYYKYNNSSELITDLSDINSLLGEHNIENTLYAIATLRKLLPQQVNDFNWQQACSLYEALPHRMQLIREHNSILFINDSKATNAEATMPALNSFENIYWIIGGIAKQGGISALENFFPKIRKAYLIGSAAQEFSQQIANKLDFIDCKNLTNAVISAYNDARLDLASGQKNAVILLSPACASYDQFANYSARGDAFTKLVHAL